MGRKRNKNSKSKTKSPSKQPANPTTTENLESQALASSDLDPTVTPTDPDFSQSDAASASESNHNEPAVDRRHLSKREQFERSRSDSSLGSEDLKQETTPVDVTASFSVGQGTSDWTAPTALDTSEASYELTQEALSLHTQLLQEKPSTHKAESKDEPQELGKRASMHSHEDCESGVGTYSARSEGTHRDDTLFDDEVHPCIGAENLEIESNVEDNVHVHQSQLSPRPEEIATESHHDLAGVSVRESTDTYSNEQPCACNLEDPSESEQLIVRGMSTDTFNAQQLETVVTGKPPPGGGGSSLQRHSSSSGSNELSRTASRSLSQTAHSELAMSGTLPQGLISSELASSSRSTPYSTLSASKTSTGMAYHSTMQSMTSGADFPLSGTGTAGSQSMAAEDLPLDDPIQPSDDHSRSSSEGKQISKARKDHEDNHDTSNICEHNETGVISSQSHSVISTGADLPHELSPAAVQLVRASLDEAEDVNRRLSLDYDLDSSLDSTQPLKFTNLGVSLFDELKMVTDNGGNSSVKSTPRKSRSHNASERDLHDTLGDTLGSISEHVDIQDDEHIHLAASSKKNSKPCDQKAQDGADTDIDDISEMASDRELGKDYESSLLSNKIPLAGANYDEDKVQQRRLYEALYKQQMDEETERYPRVSVSDIRDDNQNSSDGEPANSSRSSSRQEYSYNKFQSERSSKNSDLDADDEETERYPRVSVSDIRDLDADEYSETSNQGYIHQGKSHSPVSDSRQTAEEIFGNREHVSNTIASLNQEIHLLQEENKTLYEDMARYRGHSKQYEQKTRTLENCVRVHQTHIKELEIKLAQLHEKRESMQSVGVMTDNPLTLNTCIQVSPMSYESHTQTSSVTLNRACQSEPLDMRGLALHKQTGTEDLEKSQKSESGVSTKHGSANEIKMEEKKADLARASAMLDKLLRQMENLAGSADSTGDTEVDAILREDREPETSEKWRHLACTPISTDPKVLRLQRSLAIAAQECDFLSAKLKQSSGDLVTGPEEMCAQLEATNQKLAALRDDCDTWQCKYEGERTEVEMVRDRLQKLEKDLLMLQLENDRLSDEVKVRTEVMESGDLVSREAMDKVRQERNESETKATKLDTENKRLHEELCEVQKSRGEDLEKLSGLESTVGSLQADKAVLQVELNTLKEEYKNLQSGLAAVEKLIELRPSEVCDNELLSFELCQANAEKRLAELKKHVFEAKARPSKQQPEVKKESECAEKSDVLASSTHSARSAHSTASAANSVHNEILQQSELILKILRENGDIEDEVTLREIQSINWQDVKKSITDHLRGETENKVKSAIQQDPSTSAKTKDKQDKHSKDQERVEKGDQESEAESEESEEEASGKEEEEEQERTVEEGNSAEENQDEDPPLTFEELEVRSQLSELASALSHELGLRVNLVVESPKQSLDPPVRESTPCSLEKKAKQKMELERMNREYEELRKKRLSLLVQAYSGKPSYVTTPSSQVETTPVDNNDPITSYAEAMAKYNRDTAALRQRIHSFREELKYDRDLGFDDSPYTGRNGASSYHMASSMPGKYDSGSQNTVLKQSKDELDSLLSNSNRVPRVCVAAGNTSGKMHTSSGLKSPTGNGGFPYSFRTPRRQIYPHKAGYISRDQYYQQQNEQYYDQEGYYEEDRYDSVNGYDREEYYGEEEGEDLYDEESERAESEAYYNQQKKINARAIQKMKGKLKQNQRIIDEEQARLAEKRRLKLASASVDKLATVSGHHKLKSATLSTQSSTKYPRLGSQSTDDMWAIPTNESNKYRMSFHKDIPYEVDIISGATNPPTLKGYDPHALETARFGINTDYKPKANTNHLVDKYNTEPRRRDPSPTFKVEVTSRINSHDALPLTSLPSSEYTSSKASIPSRSKSSEVISKAPTKEYHSKQSSTKSTTDSHTNYSSNSNVDTVTSKPEPVSTSRYLLENKENYENIDSSTVTFGRGKDYNRSAYSEAGRNTEVSDMTSYLDLPSRLRGEEKIEKPSQREPAEQANKSASSRSKYRSPYDKYDVMTENNKSVIIPATSKRSNESADSHENKTHSAKDSKPSAYANTHHESRKRDVEERRRHEPKSRGSDQGKSQPVEGSKSLRSTSAARSRDSSPVRSYDIPDSKQMNSQSNATCRDSHSKSTGITENRPTTSDVSKATKAYEASERPKSARPFEVQNGQAHETKSRDSRSHDYRSTSEKNSQDYGDRRDLSPHRSKQRDYDDQPRYSQRPDIYDGKKTEPVTRRNETAAKSYDETEPCEYTSSSYRDTSPSHRSGAKGASSTDRYKPVVCQDSERYRSKSKSAYESSKTQYNKDLLEYRFSEPLQVKDRNYRGYTPATYRTTEVPSSQTAELNSRNLQSLDRAYAAQLQQEQAEDRLKAQILANQGTGLHDDVSSVAGSSDADFVVTGKGDILRRKSKAAKRFDKMRNSELQMKSFETPYEQLEDDFHQQDGLEGVDKEYAESEATETNEQDSSQYWTEPRRHFGTHSTSAALAGTVTRTSSNGGNNTKSSDLWATPKSHVEKSMDSKHISRASNTTLLDEGLNSTLVDQKWYRDAKDNLAQSFPTEDQKSKSQEKLVTDAKQTLRSRFTDVLSDKTTTNPDKMPQSAQEVLDDFEQNKKAIAELFEHKRDTNNTSDLEKSQRRVHWDSPHTKVKVMTPESNLSRLSTSSPDVAFDWSKQKDDQNASKPSTSEHFIRRDFTDTVKQMKSASGLFEVPKLSLPKELSTPKAQEDENKSVKSADKREEMILPRSIEERQHIVEDIIDKYTKDYEPSGIIKNTTENNSLDRDRSPKSSRIPVASPTRDSLSTPMASSTPLKPVKTTKPETSNAGRSVIPIRSSSKGSPERMAMASYDITPIKMPREKGFDSDKSRESSVENRQSDAFKSKASSLSSNKRPNVSPIRYPTEGSSPKTNIPIRRGSDVEDHYRRDRSSSRDSIDELKRSRELDAIINKYTRKEK